MRLDLDHLEGWIGREDHASEELTAALVARFNATFDRQSPLDHGAEAPVLIHLCLAQPIASTKALGTDGHPAKGGFLPPVPLPRRMWAGGRIDFHRPLRIGDTVSRRSVIEGIELKQGKSGPLCFVTVRHAFESGGGPALTERQDIVYREITGAGVGAAMPSEPAPAGAETRTVTASAPLLFRYSALTFNGHRIHYDAPYAKTEEGYPGLVIHGPLQATMLCQFATDLCGAAPRRFDFRSLSPIFGPDRFGLHAVPDGEALSLWTAQEGGPVSMMATAQW
ncbi:FAS1-like dehydratase domain-containing protein [Roseovarius sp.]|uniref:FAS1-like dehydratase domain-containing protein n=1 Tax=Roseovarius sp. TaxID=1486281 RepID=UPI003A982D17